jgi:2-polyprenyl-6-methoxyphenol hydroxylase-like FAD-dependent oxidoreductase
MAVNRVLIVGGGIGGLAAAYALRRKGIDATVFERAEALKKVQVGGGIQVRNNGCRALQELGLADQAEAAGQVVEKYIFKTWNGRFLGSWPVGEFGREINAPSIAIRRGALHDVLAGALGPEAVQLGAQFAGYTQDEAGVTVRFEDGREERGDLLIGADGLHSAVRAELVGDGKPRYVGFIVWRTIVELEHPLLKEQIFEVWWGSGARFSYYFVGPKQLYWFGVLACPPGGQDSAAGRKADVLDAFGGWPEPIPTVIRASDEARILRGDTCDRPPVSRWGAGGRVTLLGDAAHPVPFTQGQGANQALEDSVVLARCLAEEKDAVSGVTRYEAERIPRTTEVANVSYRFARAAVIRNPVAIAGRNAAMRVLLSTVIWKKQKEEMVYEF